MTRLLHSYYFVCFGIDLSKESGDDYFSRYDSWLKSALASNTAMSLMATAADVFITIWSLCNLSSRLNHDDIDDSAGLRAYLVALMAINIFAIPFATAVLATRMCTHKSAYLFNMQLLAQDLWAMLSTCRLCLTLVAKVWVGSCNSNMNSSHDSSFYCNPMDESRTVPTALTAILILFPILLSTCMDGVRLYAVLVTWLLVLCALIITSTMLGWSAELLQLVFLYSVPTLIMLHKLEQQRLMLFGKYRFEAVVREKDRREEECTGDEIRRIISNVAHDIKTPLAAFFGGVEAIQTLIAENIDSSSKGEASMASMLEGFKQLKESTEALNDSNSVMLMAVNRCIDYSKASNGMVLVPTMESICLEDVLAHPMSVVSNQQSRVIIRCDPLDSSRIAPSVVTDRQWLKENIQCLLSNAAKYSKEGCCVRMSIALIEQPSSEEEHGRRQVIGRAKIGRVDEHEQQQQQSMRSMSLFNSSMRSMSLFNSFRSSFAVLPAMQLQFDELDKLSQLVDKEGSSDSSDIEAATGGDGSSHPHHHPPSQHLLVEVEDSGEGLSPEEKIKLFQPFRMDIDQDAGSSAGLGLFSLARRVDALHGRYGVRSRSDGQQGNCFWFSFPYIPDHCSPVAAPPLCGLPSDNCSATSLLTEEGEQTMVMEGSGKKRMLRVLLVDDSASVLKMTRMMLQRLGCTVDIAYDGSESLQKTLQQWDNGTPYDVVLTDIQMPVKNGYEYCRELRGVEQRYSEESSAPRHQLVIGASANSDDVTAASAIRAGIDAFLGKPYSSKLFLDLVRRRLSKTTDDDDDGGNDDGDDT